MLKSIYNSVFKKKWDVNTVFTVVFALMVFVQIISVFYFNVFRLEYNYGYDASSNLLKAIQIWEQKTLFVRGFSEQHILLFDSSVPLASLFYGITGDIFVGYGLANFIIAAASVFIIARIAKTVKLSDMATLLVIAMFLCPYVLTNFHLDNFLGYSSTLFFSGGFYSLRILNILVIMLTVIGIDNKSLKLFEKIAYIVLSAALSVLCGMSSGIILIALVVVPLFVYKVTDMFIYNDRKKLLCLSSVYLAAIAFIIFISKKFVPAHVQVMDKTAQLGFVQNGTVWDSFMSIFYGFLHLIGAVSKYGEIPVLSKSGICSIAGLAIVFITIAVLIFKTCAAVKDYKKHSASMPFLTMVLVGILMFTFINTRYFNTLFEERYLVHMFISAMFLIGFAIDSVRPDKKIFKGALTLLLAGCIMFTNAYSYKTYYGFTNPVDIYEKIEASADEVGADVVYFCSGNDGEKILLIGSNMRVYDSDRVYKNITPQTYSDIHHWGDIHDLDENGECIGNNLIAAKNESFDLLPQFIKKHYSVKCENIDGNGLNLYSSEYNPFDFNDAIIAQRNIEFMYSSNINIAFGEIDDEDGSFVTDGTEDCCMSYIMNCEREGNYDITLYYEKLTDEGTGELVLVGPDGKNVAVMSDEDKAVIENVHFSMGEQYALYMSESGGAAFRLDRVEVNAAE